jgi:hypothetical protein
MTVMLSSSPRPCSTVVSRSILLLAMLSPDAVGRLLSAQPGSLTDDERVAVTLLLLDQSVHGSQTYEDYYRAGGSPHSVMVALVAVGATRAASALRDVLASHFPGSLDAHNVALELDEGDEALILRLRNGLDTYEEVVEEIASCLNRFVAQRGLW